MSQCLSRVVHRLLSFRKDVGYSVFGIGNAEPCPRGYYPGQICLVTRRNRSLPESVDKSAFYRATLRDFIPFRNRSIGT